jgi:gamma-glutamyltranspeptidase/glutathione hydrolase
VIGGFSSWRRAVAALLLAGLAGGCAPGPRAERDSRALPARDPADRATAVGTRGAVSSAEENASQVGLDMLRRGGNAVDAAVALGFALGVTHPSAGNIGGGGFMVISLPGGERIALDYRERAPAEATRDMFLEPDGQGAERSRVGALAAGIPGTVAGLAWAHAHHGTLPWEELLAPAVSLARDGWILDRFHAADLERAAAAMERYGFPSSAALFRRPDGSPLQAGDRWRQPDLARTLERIAHGGPESFYRGELAEQMVRAVRAAGGIWSAEDLAAYTAVARAPLVFRYRGHEIVSMPPPSAGGVVLRQVLGASELLGLHAQPWDAPERVHLYIETLRRVYADRNRWLGDPDYVEIPLARLLDPAYLTRRLADIDPRHATPSSAVGAGDAAAESPETTHFSVADASGMAVANTYTLNGGFGAKQVIEGTGVILNNEMDDFTTRVGVPNMFGLVQGEANAIAPGKRMLSSMTPAIVLRDGALRAVLGSPGGPSISTTVAQIALQLIDYGRSISEAVRAPRIHHQWLPDVVMVEESVDAALVAALEARGHRVVRRPSIGHANCLEVDPLTGGFRAIADEARDGGRALAF